MACSPDGTTVASVAGDGTVRLWDIARGEARGEPLRSLTSKISSVAFSPVGDTIVSGGTDGTVRLWDAVSGRERGSALQAHAGSVTAVAFMADRSLLSVGADKTLRLWDTDTWLGAVTPPQGHAGEVTSVAISRDGQTIVSAGSDGAVRQWNATGEPRGVQVAGGTRGSTLAAFSADGRTITAFSSDGTLRVWDALVRAPGADLLRVTVRAKLRENTPLALSADGKTIAAVGADGNLLLLDGATGELRGSPWPANDHVLVVSRLAFSPDGKTLVSAAYGQVRSWDVATRQQRGETMRASGGFIAVSLAVSPDHKTIAAGTVDSLLLWDATTGELRVPPIRAHTGSVTSVTMSPDSRTVVSGGDDATVRMWDLASGQALGVPRQGRAGGVKSLAFSPDGKTIVSGGHDGTCAAVGCAQRLGRPHLRQARAQSQPGRMEAVCGEYSLHDAVSGFTSPGALTAEHSYIERVNCPRRCELGACTPQAFRGVRLVRKDFTGSGQDDAHGHDTHTAGTIFGRAVHRSSPSLGDPRGASCRGFYLADARFDGVDDVGRRRGAGRQPDDFRGVEPLGPDVGLCLHVMHAGAVARTGLYQLARVVARPAADHDHDVGLACHLDRRGLPVLGGLADRVEKAHVRLREPPSDQGEQVLHFLYRLRRLGRHPDAWVLLEREDVVVFEHDVEAIEIAGEAAHLHVVALPDDDDVVAVAREGRDGTVRDVYERAGGFDHPQPQGAAPRETAFGRAVGGHHQGRRLDVGDVLGDRDALGLKAAQDGRVVDEVPKDREGAGVGVLMGQRDGISNAEAHAEVGRSKDTHNLIG